MLLAAVSDLHLGQPFNLRAWRGFLAYLRTVRPELLLLLGDVLELAWFSRKELEAQELFRESLDELRGFAASIETLYFPGNHDPRKKIDPQMVAPVHLLPFRPDMPEATEFDGVLYTHGSQFDAGTHLWDALLKFPLKAVFPCVYLKLYGTPYEVKSAQKEQDYREYVGWIMGRAMMEAIRQGRDVVFGHTHAPMTLDLGGRLIVNSGDLRDSWSYVLARDGRLELKFWRPA